MAELLVVPEIGCTGTFELGEPFTSDILSGQRYTCQALRRISDYIANNEDPYKLVYAPKNLSKDVYEADRAANAIIVSLQAAVGQWVHVPAKYIVSYPAISGVAYRGMAINVALPPVPRDLDTKAVEEAIKEAILMTLGITQTSVKFVETSKPVQISEDKHRTIQTQRKAAGAGVTKTYMLHRANETIRLLRQQIRALEDYIVARL